MARTAQRVYSPPPPEPLLRIADALAWLRISRRTFYRLIDQGELTPIYFDSHPRFDPEELKALIESRKKTSRPASGSSSAVPYPGKSNGRDED